MRTGFSGLALIAAAVTAAGCGFSTKVKTKFANENYCPADRVTVAERPDLKHPIALPGYEPPAPPAEIQADPERLALYVEEAKKRRRSLSWVDDPETYYEVQGCGHRTVYKCSSLRRRECLALP
jgi:hypothetical protein